MNALLTLCIATHVALATTQANRIEPQWPPRVFGLEQKLASVIDVAQRRELQMARIASAYTAHAQLLAHQGLLSGNTNELLPALSLLELSLLARAADVRDVAKQRCADAVSRDPCLQARFDAEYDMCFVERICAPDERRATLPCTQYRLDNVKRVLAHLDTLELGGSTQAELECTARARPLPCVASFYDAARDECVDMQLCDDSSECSAAAAEWQGALTDFVRSVQ